MCGCIADNVCGGQMYRDDFASWLQHGVILMTQVWGGEEREPALLPSAVSGYWFCLEGFRRDAFVSWDEDRTRRRPWWLCFSNAGVALAVSLNDRAGARWSLTLLIWVHLRIWTQPLSTVYCRDDIMKRRDDRPHCWSLGLSESPSTSIETCFTQESKHGTCLTCACVTKVQET